METFRHIGKKSGNIVRTGLGVGHSENIFAVLFEQISRQFKMKLRIFRVNMFDQLIAEGNVNRTFGKTFERVLNNDDAISYALSIVEDPTTDRLLFAGTDDGLYVSINAGEKWQKWTQGFPTVSVKDLVIHPREPDLIIGTFGRAAWVLDDITPLREAAMGTLSRKRKSKKLQLYKPPTSYLASYQQPTGSRFGADALYNGENRGRGARIRYFYDKQADTLKDSLHLKIYDGQRLIRTLKQKAPDSTGLYEFRWYLNEKGGDRASRSMRKRSSEPGGVTVLPGTFRLELSQGDNNSSSSTIVVKDDPRINRPDGALQARYDAGKKIQAYNQTAADAVNQLHSSKKIAEGFKSQLKAIDKEKYKVAIDSSTAIIKAIDREIDIFLGKIDERQGITRNPEQTPLNRLGTASWYSSSRPAGLTRTEKQLLTQAEDALQKALDQVNLFYTTEWKTYEKQMNALDINPFKEVESFQLKDN